MSDDVVDPKLQPTQQYADDAIQRARNLLQAPPEQIGPYRILERIGGGGMGEVFRAEQRHPIRREVALKFIKLGMDTRAVIARFEAERQALALMDHPHIAKVLDAGTDDTGRPFFVMEYVKGKPITEYADKNQLNIAERLELVEQVCQAIQHAHHKGVIHRDLKPSNVLVSTHDGKPFAKVIDFGIAKAIGQQLTDKTLFTLHSEFIGTPQYMSPEQAEGSLDIDTRTDIYSLGVLLYELLAGSPPFSATELKLLAWDQFRKQIIEVDPPKPSLRLSTSGPALSTLATSRRTEPKRLGNLVRGELDWIVMKALEKDRKRRYETPNSLANDLRAHLSGRPIQAAPPSITYQFRKLITRYRGPVYAIAAVMLVLLIGIATTTFQMIRAREAELSVRAMNSELQEYTDSLQKVTEQIYAELWVAKEDILKTKSLPALGSEWTAWGSYRLHVNNENGSLTVVSGFAREPSTQQTSVSVEVPDASLAGEFRDLVPIDKTSNPSQSRRDLIAFLKEQPIILAQLVRESQAKLVESRERAEAREAETSAVLTFLETHILSAARPVGFPHGLGHEVKLRDAIRQALPFVDKQFHDQPLTEARLRSTLGETFLSLTDYRVAVDQLKRAMQLRENTLGADHIDSMISRFKYAREAILVQKPDESLQVVERLLPQFRQLLGENAWYTHAAQNLLVACYIRTSQLNAALPLAEKCVHNFHLVKDPNYTEAVWHYINLSEIYKRMGQKEDAVTVLLAAKSLAETHLGPEHIVSLDASTGLMETYAHSGEYEKAIAVADTLIPLRKKVLGSKNFRTIYCMRLLSTCYSRLGRHIERERVEHEIVASTPTLVLAGKDEVSDFVTIARHLDATGRRKEATQFLELILSDLASLPDQAGRYTTLLTLLADEYAIAGRHADEVSVCLRLIDSMEAAKSEDCSGLVDLMHRTSLRMSRIGKYQDAIRMLHGALTKSTNCQGESHERTLGIRINLANFLRSADQMEDALIIDMKTATLARSSLPASHRYIPESEWGIARCLYRMGRGEEALQYWRRCVDAANAPNINAGMLPSIFEDWHGYLVSQQRVADAASVIALWESFQRKDSYSFVMTARFHALQSQLYRDGSTELISAQEEVELVRAIAAIHAAIDSGFTYHAYLLKDHSLDALKHRSDFQSELSRIMPVPSEPPSKK